MSAGILQGMRCVVNRSLLMARMSGPRNFLQDKCMHTAISSSGVFAPSLVKSVQVIQYFFFGNENFVCLGTGSAIRSVINYYYYYY